MTQKNALSVNTEIIKYHEGYFWNALVGMALKLDWNRTVKLPLKLEELRNEVLRTLNGLKPCSAV